MRSSRPARSSYLVQTVSRLTSAHHQKRPLDLSRQLDRLYESYPAEFRRLIQGGVLKSRTAYYLLKIGRMVREARPPTARAEAIGWTKLHLIADYAGPRQAKSLLKLAERLTTQELKSVLRDQNAHRRPHCVQLYFSAAQYQAFSRAVLRNGATRARRGLRSKEQATIRIIRAADR